MHNDPHLVWGKRNERADYRFRGRAAIVEHLVSRWAKSDWSAVDVSGGAGRWLSTLAPRFRHFTHLDFSRDALCVARREHPELDNVEYGFMDLLRPKLNEPTGCDRTWDVVFCLDTLLYRGDFVETALTNMRGFISEQGIAIIDVPSNLRSSISRRVKGRSYGGPERTFSRSAVLRLVEHSGYTCIDVAYHYREMTPSMHNRLVEREFTGWIPWPSTWIYLVIRPRGSP